MYLRGVETFTLQIRVIHLYMIAAIYDEAVFPVLLRVREGTVRHPGVAVILRGHTFSN